jgi:hypothetical protein
MGFGSRFFGPRKTAKGSTVRRVAGTMNKTETRYEVEVLVPACRSGAVLWYVYEGVTFKLGPDLRYTPDFIVQRANGEIECRDVKPANKDGEPMIEDAGRVKMIAAAEKYPFRFSATWYDKTKGTWDEKAY